MYDNLSFKSLKKYKKKIKSKKKLVALVTGGLGRIGSVFTGSLLYEKNIVIVLSRYNKDYKLYKKKLPINLRKNLYWYHLDFNEPNKLNEVTSLIIKKFKKIDILINNASDGRRGKFLDYNLNSLNKELWGTFGTTMLLTENILPFMRKNRFGKIINVGSIWGIRAPKFKTYLNLNNGPSPIISSSKGALAQYTKHIASREVDFNITANMLIPGFFPRKGKVANRKYIKSINSNIPMNRVGKLEDLICAVDFILSKENSYFTGQSVIVDGGYTIW
jgi:NAD(P)-dependent dehydrogenase (short-subunit alcohol dehydrogenase family)